MALSAPGASARATRPQPKAGSISSLRIRPFTRISRGVLGSQRKQLVPRAAEPEAAAVEEEFSFSLSDAKKGNEYVASDVEAALAFYQGERPDAPGEVNSEFVENVFGLEDASFFDDMDNTEAYEDEFVVAGIPEAAPKQRQSGRGRGGPGGPGAEAEDADEITAAKEAGRFKQVEENLILQSQMEEMGLDRAPAEEETVVVNSAGAWDWMSNLLEDGDDDVDPSSAPKLLRKSVLEALPADEELFADVRNASASMQDVDAETRDTIDFLLDDFDIESELRVIPDDVEQSFEAIADGPALNEDDIKRIDALLAEDITLPELDLGEVGDVEQVADDGTELSEAVVQNYVASLKEAKAAELTEEQIKEAFGDEPVTLVDLSAEQAVTLDDVDLTEPALEAVALTEEELTVQALEDDLTEFAEVEEYRAELAALRSAPEPAIEVPPAEELEVLGQYLAASQQFLDAEESRKAQLAAQVAAGELPADVLEDEDLGLVDVESELLAPGAWDGEVDEESSARSDDAENWQERILELTRVTKVVKGGKLMGFRCTAVVGNNAGLVGVGCQAGREIATAVKRALVDAKKNVVQVPLVGAGTVPHRVEAKFNAARCVILPAADGTGVLAGGAIRSVLELAGVQNVLAKRLGCRSLLNNARCAVAALEQLRTLQDVSKARGVPMERLLLPK